LALSSNTENAEEVELENLHPQGWFDSSVSLENRFEERKPS
jgi:hypothetical protein